MPLIKSAKKKLRQDKKRQLDNKKIKNTYKSVLKEARENPSIKALEEAFSALDKAAKKGIIHENKAARLKSSVSKLLQPKKTESKVTTKTTISAQPKKKSTPKK